MGWEGWVGDCNQQVFSDPKSSCLSKFALLIDLSFLTEAHKTERVFLRDGRCQPLRVNDVCFERDNLIPNFAGTVTFADERVLTIGPVFPLQLGRRQWDYESKFGSSEDSETDQYSDYGRGSLPMFN